LPDSNRTPGAIDPSVTQENILTTICVSGYTSKVRPSSSYTTALKEKQLKSGYAVDGNQDLSKYEEDHLIPLELGGNPTSEDNLWPQFLTGNTGAVSKDKLENLLHKLVCDNQLKLSQAQNAIAQDWVEAYDWFVTGRQGTISLNSWHLPTKSIVGMNFYYEPSKYQNNSPSGSKDKTIGSVSCDMDKVHQVDVSLYGINHWSLVIKNPDGYTSDPIEWDSNSNVSMSSGELVNQTGNYQCLATLSGLSGVVAEIVGSINVVDISLRYRATTVQQNLVAKPASSTLITNPPSSVKTSVAVSSKVTIFKNCTEMNKVYPGGVAKVGAVNQGGATKNEPKYDNSLYVANKKSDRDGDGIACEK